MSSTPKAHDDSIFPQARYAGSLEFERGLLANLVAKRCALIDDAAVRELLWFIQSLSHQDGGLARVAKELIANFPGRLQTTEMAALQLKPGKNCSAEQVRKIRQDLPYEIAQAFPVKGDAPSPDLSMEALLDREENPHDGPELPTGYPTCKFFDLCSNAAASELEKSLQEICLNPKVSLATGPWYFPLLIESLREFKTDFIQRKGAGVVVTALGEKVSGTLDYTAYSRGLTLMQGDARTGKSFAARAWCDQRPGLARFVEVPPGNDEIGFFHGLARGLGLGNFANYNTTQIRERIESVLLTGDLLLVLDEAQRLWPRSGLRHGADPKRIVWVMKWANAGVPIAMISTPQFIETQKAVEKAGWNSAQLTGRISHFESLPVDLSADDLMAVAKSVLPEAGAQVLRALAVYARSSARYLAAIDSISKRARYITMRAGRDIVTTEDVRKAMQESVIPADTKLQLALVNGKKSKAEPMRRCPAPAVPLDEPPQDSAGTRCELAPTRGSADLDAIGTLPGARQRAGIEAVLTGH